MFIDCEQDGSFTLQFPYIDKESYSSVYKDAAALGVFLKQYLEHTPSPDETFLLQDYVENIEVSAVFIDGKPHFIRREPGSESHVAHYRYGGKDTLITAPDRALVSFVQKIYTVLPEKIQNTPFFRIDVMWDSLHEKYVFGEIEGAGAARLWMEEAGRVEDYAQMLVKLAKGSAGKASEVSVSGLQSKKLNSF